MVFASILATGLAGNAYCGQPPVEIVWGSPAPSDAKPVDPAVADVVQTVDIGGYAYGIRVDSVARIYNSKGLFMVQIAAHGQAAIALAEHIWAENGVPDVQVTALLFTYHKEGIPILGCAQPDKGPGRTYLADVPIVCHWTEEPSRAPN